MSPFPAWRQELFFKSPQQLQAQIALLKDLHQSRLNITNKSKDDDLLKVVDTLKQQLGAKLDRWWQKNYNAFPRGIAAAVQEIYGSIFIPSKQLLAQQKFRPWSGVFLSKQYLDSVDEARAITVQMLQIYKRYEVTPLVETAVRDAKALRGIMDIFEEAAK
ncbi:hypothetical protein WJX73_005323 [Symbiochloris irregularis]|uniref:Uncharacterized protein n=1 Tax=Symbiochloris irregularis TaxID=706552 RepID=A0AAW1NQ14_9CHLO